MATETSTHLNIKCPNCGSPEVVFHAGNQALTCSHCGYEKQLPKETHEIVEQPLGASFHLEDAQTGLEIVTKAYHCNGCGADVAVEADQVNFACPFCGSENVNESALDTRIIRPAGVMPFKVEKSTALDAFKHWLGQGWFRPGDLAKKAQVDKLKGVYLPFWTFDAHTSSQWRADAGYYYYVQESYTDSDGNRQTRQVRKVRWEPAAGRHSEFFDDVMVIASQGVSQDMMEDILPFNIKDVVNYDSRYLLGWETELYQKDLKEGFGVADDIMDQAIRAACSRAVPGDTQRNLRVKTQKTGLTFKHLLLPVWVAGYTYKGKIYQFIVNGQNGQVAGKKPWSAIKIALAVLAAAAVAAAIWYFSEMQGNGPIVFE
ncbi:hypothetical protein [Pontibacter sp. G13]|uniref:hypothetical protein n=1 Tax=Pontibacter sp. G13 TaxID=3074898 RepID=UPI00288913BE|nr:hypothetical protein [Pontibacter sp. G13]WNJ19539.1 hypothetical protein RJD25_03525 [Pontibacter sp. G13]